MDFETKAQLQDIILKEEMDKKLAIIEVMKKTNAEFDVEEALRYDQFDIVEGLEDFENRIPEFFDTKILDTKLPLPIKLHPIGPNVRRYLDGREDRFIEFLLDCDWDLMQEKFCQMEYSTEKRCHSIVLDKNFFILKQKHQFFINSNGGQKIFRHIQKLTSFNNTKIPLTEDIFRFFISNIKKIANVEILLKESFMTIEFDKEGLLKTIQCELCFNVLSDDLDVYIKELNDLEDIDAEKEED